MSRAILRPTGRSKQIKSERKFAWSGDQCQRNRDDNTEQWGALQSKSEKSFLQQSDQSKIPFEIKPHRKPNKRLPVLPEKSRIEKIVHPKSDKVADKHNTEKNIEGTKNSRKNLEELSDQILSKVRIIILENNLYYFDGRIYRIIKDGDDLLRLVRSKISENAFGSSTIRQFPELYKYLKSDERLFLEDYEEYLDRAENLVAFQNGVLDLENNQFLRHSDTYLLFFELNANWIEKPHAKQFSLFLKEVARGDKEIIQRILESLGYLISSLNRKKFFVMGTSPDSGKSVLGKLLKKIIGKEFVSALSPVQMGGRFSLSSLNGKVLNLSMDLPKGNLSSTAVSVIKQISGGDLIATEKKFEKIEEVYCNTRFLFASNYPLTISREDDDDSFWDRMVIIPFLYSVEKEYQDTELLNKLIQEKDDIISICLSALQKVVQNNYVFSECREADRMKFAWRYREQDISGTIQPFVDNYLEVTGVLEDEIFTRELYHQYLAYCKEVEKAGVGENVFIKWCDKNLEGTFRKKIHHTNMNGRSGYVGLRWKER